MRRFGLLVACWLGGMAPPIAACADQAAGVAAYEAGDYGKAFHEWKAAAEQGDILAMRNLGQLYRWGKGVERDLEKAADWYRRAADKGFEPAQLNLAFMYLDGQGVAQDLVEAARWFEMATLQRNPVAQYQLALLLDEGRGVPADRERALLLYRLAAEGGLAQAKLRLAELAPSESGAPMVRAVAASPMTSGEVPQLAIAAEPAALATTPAVTAAKPEAASASEEAAKESGPENKPKAQPEAIGSGAPPLGEAKPQAAPIDPAPAAGHEGEEKVAAAGRSSKPMRSKRTEVVEAAPALNRAAAPIGALAHLASYHDHATAEKGWRVLVADHPELRDLQPRVIESELPGKGNVYRLYAVGPRAQLSTLCEAFQRQSVFCRLKRQD